MKCQLAEILTTLIAISAANSALPPKSAELKPVTMPVQVAHHSVRNQRQVSPVVYISDKGQITTENDTDVE